MNLKQSTYRAFGIASARESLFFTWVIFMMLSSIWVCGYAQSPEGEPGGDKKITGYLSSRGSKLSNANIFVKDTERKTFSEDDGWYEITASPGEVLIFSYTGLKTVEVILEDVSSVLNITMYPESRMLSEVRLRASSNSSTIPREFDTYFGKIDRTRAGYATNYLSGDQLNSVAYDIVEGLAGKVPGYRFSVDNTGKKKAYLRDVRQAALWEVDGVLFEEEPPFINPADVIDVNVIKSPAGLVRYGSLGRGGVIIVRTRAGDLKRSNMEQQRARVSVTNNYFYEQDAVSLQTQKRIRTGYLLKLDSVTHAEELLQLYKKLLPVYAEQAAFHLDFYDKLLDQKAKKQDKEFLLKQMQSSLFYNPVGLKSMAYMLQKHDQEEQATKVYQRIISLRPSYAQSYRDLAHSLRETGEVEQSWNYYMDYLIQRDSLDIQGIDEIIYREMEEIFYRRPKGFRPEAKFQVIGEVKDIPQDLRAVFEWDNSEAEFDLEFVNPDGRAYSFLHNFEFNEDQIRDEKTKGYSSTQFFIEKLEKSGWLINLTYYGNKTNHPTYLKMTLYRNWARKGEKKEVHLIRLTEKNRKFQLKRI